MLSETGLSDALGLYDRSNLEVRTLKSRLHEDEVGGIVEEVLKSRESACKPPYRHDRCAIPS